MEKHRVGALGVALLLVFGLMVSPALASDRGGIVASGRFWTEVHFDQADQIVRQPEESYVLIEYSRNCSFSGATVPLLYDYAERTGTAMYGLDLLDPLYGSTEDFYAPGFSFGPGVYPIAFVYNAANGRKVASGNISTVTSLAVLMREAGLEIPGSEGSDFWASADGKTLNGYFGTGGEVAIPEGITEISAKVFEEVPGVTALTLPASTLYFSGYDLSEHSIPNVERYRVAPGCAAYSAEDGFLLSGDGKTLLSCPPAKAGAAVTPAGVTAIGESCFRSSNLHTLAVSEGVERIEGFAFPFAGFTSITLPDSLTFIGEDAFYGCTELTALHLPKGVKTLESKALAAYYTEIDFPNDELVYIPRSSLTTYTVDKENPYFTAADGVLYSKNRDTLVAVPQTWDTPFTVPATVRSLGGGAFYGCAWLASVTLPDGLTALLDYSFSECRSLRQVNLPASVRTIGRSAFSNTALEEITLPAGLLEIGSGALSSTALTEITIPGSVRSICSHAFSYNPKLRAVVIESGIDALPSYLFFECPALETVEIPKSAVNIDENCLDTGASSTPSIRGWAGSQAENTAKASGLPFLPLAEEFQSYAQEYGFAAAFAPARGYQPFSDVAWDAWYHKPVQVAYESGLIDGAGNGRFLPGDGLTTAQAVKFAACIHSKYIMGEISFLATTPWHQSYVGYAKANGLSPALLEGLDQPVSRAVFAAILSWALPDGALPALHPVADGSISDVPAAHAQGAEIYRLYRAGILTGASSGGFLPQNGITRAEAAAVVARMIDFSLRA